MKKQQKAILVLVTIAVFVTTAAFLPGLVRAGDLEPPGDSPGPTMHTLEEIYQKLETIDTKLEPDGQPCEPCAEAPVPRTGQTESYGIEDDGDLEKGVPWPDPRFTIHHNDPVNDDDTVTDNLTGLMWTRDATIWDQTTWGAALSSCYNCTVGGHGDWRLPNLRELLSLIDYSQGNPAVCNTIGDGHWMQGDPFIDLVAGRYWSSTSYTVPTNAWTVVFEHGDVYYHESKNFYHYVWCVRGGGGQ